MFGPASSETRLSEGRAHKISTSASAYDASVIDDGSQPRARQYSITSGSARICGRGPTTGPRWLKLNNLKLSLTEELIRVRVVRSNNGELEARSSVFGVARTLSLL